MAESRGKRDPQPSRRSVSSDVWPFVVEPLVADHHRAAFSCGHESLDRFIREFASQNIRSGVSQTFVAVRHNAVSGSRRVCGYYCLSAGKLELTALPESHRKRLPRYPLPVVHLGRLAVDASSRGEGLGEHLLLDAIHRTVRVSTSIGVHALEVVAIDAAARGFYRKYGFVELTDDAAGQHMYLPIATLKKLGLGA